MPSATVARRGPALSLIARTAAAVLVPALPLHADLLTPSDVAPLGPLSLDPGVYTIDTSGPTPTLRDAVGTVLFSGTVVNQAVPDDEPFFGFNPDLAVFSFTTIDLPDGVTVTATGDHPLVLLSQTTLTLGGVIDVSGRDGSNATGNLGGTGDGAGGAGGPGGGRGGDGGVGAAKGENGDGPGGGFGGFGGLSSRGNGAGFGGRGGGGFGGLVDESVYGDLTQFLQAGSGAGGTGTDFALTQGAGGGGGGGGLQLTAGASIELLSTAEVLANGGTGGGGSTVLAGGGSGGGLIFTAPVIDGGGTVSAAGGGFNGGGGRILFLTADGEPVGGFSALFAGHGPTGGENGVILNGVLPGTGLIGDLNGDGFVGAGDLDILLGLWNQNVDDGMPADLNGDGFIGAGDLDVMLGNWNAGTPPAAQSVPEPNALLLLAAGVLAGCRVRRAR